MFQVLILNSRPEAKKPVLFQGQSQSIFLPGQTGEFEILDFHKPVISRLKKGAILVDNEKAFPIKGGIVKMDHQRLVAMVDV